MTNTKKNKVKIRLQLLSLFLFISLITNAQDYDYNIELNYSNSMRIPYHLVQVKATKKGNQTSISVFTKSLKNFEKWNKYNIDTTFTISTDNFNEIIRAFAKIKSTDVIINVGLVGLDGASCELKYSSYASHVSYLVQCPNIHEDGYLKDFVQCCILLLKTAGLKPEEILE